MVVRRGQIRWIGWVIKKLKSQVGQFLLGCRCPVSRDIFLQEQDFLGDIPPEFFLQNVLQLHQQRWVVLRVDSLALWKMINEDDAIFIPKISRREILQRIFALGIFWGGVSRYAATLFIVALFPSHSDITRLHPWSPIATENYLDREEKIPNLVALLTFLIRVQTFRDPFRGELPHVQIFKNDGPNALTWEAQLLNYWFSLNPAVFQD